MTVEIQTEPKLAWTHVGIAALLAFMAVVIALYTK
jgi:hypothetical protein